MGHTHLNTIRNSALKNSAAPFALALALIAAPAFAQDAPQAAEAEAIADDQPVIVVTGSRIVNPNLQSSVPVAVVSSDRIAATGVTNIQDVLTQLPSVGQGITRSSSNFNSTGNGQATLNLRNLGDQRTLVLINGRRTVGIPGSSAADLNHIPLELISRVETVTGGASAAYGSEAIAGVVNFVLKRNFSGLEIHGQSTVSDKGDAPRQYVSLLGGLNFAQGRGNITLNLSYDNDAGLRSRNRAFSANDVPNRSSYAAQGLFSVVDLNDPAQAGFFAGDGLTYTFDANNNLKDYQGANIDGYDRNQQRFLAVPVKRYTASALGHYDLGFGDLYAEGTYVKTKSNASLEAQAIDNLSATPVTNFDGSAYAGIPITSPYVPQAIRDAAVANGVNVIQFRRRSVDIFDRSNRNDRDYWRGVIGLKGDLGGKWSYDINYEHSQVRDFTTSETIFAANYGAALSNEIDGAGNVVCSDPAARAAGCAPINIFGFNTVSSAAASWLQIDTTTGRRAPFQYVAKVFQDFASATVNGELFSISGKDAIGVAAGFEYRNERSSETFDLATQQGRSLGNQLSNTQGSFNVKEGFIDLIAPLVQDVPFVHYLGVEGSARYADYSTVGGIWSYKFGGAYAPSEDIRFRAIYARAVRAPNVGELFSTTSQTFPAIIDPCDQREGNGDGADLVALPAACANIAGIAGTVAARGAFAYSTAQIQTIDGLVGGNRNLRAEKSDTLTVGAVITPSFLRGFNMSVDYYRIKVLNAISTVGQQISVSECVNSGDPVFCNNVERDSNGFITRVNDLLLNTAAVEAAGIDTEAHYVLPVGFLGDEGRIGADVFWNHKFTQQRTPYPGGNVQDEINQAACYSCGRLGSGFRDSVTANFSLSNARIRFNYNLRYLSPLSDNLDGSTPVVTRIPAYTYHDFQLRAMVGESKKIDVYLGVNNAFDKLPPLFSDTNPVSWPGTRTVANTYDVFGRMLYIGVSARY